MIRNITHASFAVQMLLNKWMRLQRSAREHALATLRRCTVAVPNLGSEEDKDEEDEDEQKEEEGQEDKDCGRVG